MKPIYQEIRAAYGWDEECMAKLEDAMSREDLPTLVRGERFWMAKIVALVEKLTADRDALKARLDRTLDREKYV